MFRIVGSQDILKILVLLTDPDRELSFRNSCPAIFTAQLAHMIASRLLTIVQFQSSCVGQRSAIRVLEPKSFYKQVSDVTK